MSSALSPRRDSKLRWSRSKIPSSSDSKSPQSEKPSSTKLSLNLFFGLRSRKSASPVVQDHPTPLASPASIIPDPDFNPIRRSNRPPSKSVSSTRSHVDSIGPKTPTDGLRESRQSLLTLSDHDPFAGRGITVVSSPQSAIGPNRLSIYSNSSLPDVGKSEHRIGFNSPLSSPSSRPLSPDSAQFSPASPRPDVNFPSKSVLKKHSSDLSKKRPVTASDVSFGTAIEGTLFKSESASTLTDKSRSVATSPTRPPRARGMTEGAMSFPNYQISVQMPLHSRRLSRQFSLSRLGSPPSAPPMHDLPPPPLSPVPPQNDASGIDNSAILTEPISPSRSLFTYSPRKKGSDSATRGSQKSPSIRGPKKATSCNSLVMADVSRSSGELSESYLEEDKGKDQGERSPPKQRSFHHSRLPALQMLSRSVNTLPMPSSPTRSQSPTVEQRRGSNSSLPSRRRLFSGGGRRPSTSQGTSFEDDALSIFSLRSEQSLSISTSRPWTSSSCPQSPPGEGATEEPCSPLLASKYTPQRIMTPAEMAQVEASVEAVSSRARGLSISTITSRKDKDDYSTPATSPALSSFIGGSSKSSAFPSRNSSLTFKGSNSPTRSSMRNITRAVNSSPDASEHVSYRPSSSPPLPFISLPPPPRPRKRTTTAPSSIRLSRPASRQDAELQTSLQPPPRRALHARASAEALLRHYSMLRKSSFLEIDDDGAQNLHEKGEPNPSPGDSFLDLTRESFDVNYR